MGWSITVGSVAGTKVRIHITAALVLRRYEIDVVAADPDIDRNILLLWGVSFRLHHIEERCINILERARRVALQRDKEIDICAAPISRSLCERAARMHIAKLNSSPCIEYGLQDRLHAAHRRSEARIYRLAGKYGLQIGIGGHGIDLCVEFYPKSGFARA
jgi:hypothetical protein